MRYCFTIFVILCYSAKAQYFTKHDSWKKERKEVIVGGGASNFLGDLGGLNRVGTHYSYADLELVLTSPSASVGYRYRINKRFASRTDFSYLLVKGDDKLTLEPFRHNRNLNFRSNIFELSTVVEVSLSFDRHGNKYHIKKTMFRRYKQYSSYYYIFAGVGGFYFNPRSKYEGVWYNLHDLSTEGEGLPGSNVKQYKRVSISIPIGIGLRYRINDRWTLGLEYNFRKTFTDYIDDVSGNYYDKAKLLQYKGPVAVALADPNLGLIKGQTDPSASGGAQRGDKRDKDAYMNLQFKVGYVLKNKKRRRTTKAKF
jgi:hypothetical protein